MKAKDTPQLVQALEMERSGDWDGAHRMVQEIPSRDAARVHAWLHRIEGDLGNAQYWYNRAGEPMPDGSLDEERDMLLARFRNSQ